MSFPGSRPCRSAVSHYCNRTPLFSRRWEPISYGWRWVSQGRGALVMGETLLAECG